MVNNEVEKDSYRQTQGRTWLRNDRFSRKELPCSKLLGWEHTGLKMLSATILENGRVFPDMIENQHGTIN